MEITVDYVFNMTIWMIGLALFYARIIATDQRPGIAFINCFGQMACAWLVTLQLNQWGVEPRSWVLKAILYMSLCAFVSWFGQLTLGMFA